MIVFSHHHKETCHTKTASMPAPMSSFREHVSQDEIDPKPRLGWLTQDHSNLRQPWVAFTLCKPLIGLAHVAPT